MNRTLTEQQVLNALNIPDFRHLSKDSVLSFANLLPQMDPQVAEKALEQFPYFAKASLDALADFKEITLNSIESSSHSTNSCMAAYNRIMDSLTKMLDEDDLTFDQKMHILDQMREMASKIDDADIRHKKVLLNAIGMAGVAALGLMIVLGSALGVNVETIIKPIEKLKDN